MASSASDTDRFRSATEFPKTIQGLAHQQADTLYAEMRDCLIFTNRSRAQLIRRNTEHKDTTLQLRERIRHFQSLIDQLQTQKQTQLQQKEVLIAQLASEMAEMGTQLDVLSDAFDAVGDPEAMVQTHWGYVAFPGRFLQLVKAVKAVILWWKQRDEDADRLSGEQQPVLPGDSEADRRDRPQLYTDQASINRSLLDP